MGLISELLDDVADNFISAVLHDIQNPETQAFINQFIDNKFIELTNVNINNPLIRGTYDKFTTNLKTGLIQTLGIIDKNDPIPDLDRTKEFMQSEINTKTNDFFERMKSHVKEKNNITE